MENLRWQVAVLLCAIGAQSANAGVIYDNGSTGQPSTTGSIGVFSDYDSQGSVGSQQVADDFVLSAGANIIRDIHWWGAYWFNNTPTEPDNFVIRIFEEDPNNPFEAVPTASPLVERAVGEANRTATGNMVGIFDEYVYWASVDPIVLDAGTTYWISIVNDTTADTDDIWSWFFTDEHHGDQFAYRVADGERWYSFSGEVDLAFQLTDDANAVPEPASVVILGIGMVALLANPFRRRWLNLRA